MNNHSEISAARVRPRRSDGRRFADWRLALKSILGFWLVYYLTVVGRAFLSPDPGTIMFNRSFTMIIGILLTFGIYAAIKLFGRQDNLRRLVIIGVLASFLAAAAQAAVLIAVDRYQEKPEDELRFVSREGHRVVETGNQLRVEREGQEPLVLTYPRIGELQPWIQFRVAADS